MYHYTSTRMSELKGDDSKWCDVEQQKLSYIAGKKCKLLQPLWKVVWHSLLNLNM